MRILAITSLYPNPFQPNLATFNCQQFRALAERHPLALISPISWTREIAARWNGQQKLPPRRRFNESNLSIVHPRYLFPPKILRGWYGHCFRQSIARAFRQALADFRPEVVLAAWAYPDGWAAVKLAHAAGLPIALKVHGSDILTLDRASTRWERTAEALHEAEAIIAVSQDLADNVASFGIAAQKVRVIYNGIDGELFSPGPKDQARADLGLDVRAPLLLFVGNLFPVKGPDVLISACAKLKARRIAFNCVMIGGGTMQPQLEQQIRSLGLDKQVRLLGSRSHRELPAWFRAADVLVLPSHSEGVPNVLLEAVACGTRFVASRVGGVPEVAHQGVGWLVPPADSEALAQGLATALQADNSDFPAHRPAMRSHADAAGEVLETLEHARARYLHRAHARMVPR